MIKMKFSSYHIVVLPCDTPVAEFDAAVVNFNVIINCALHIGNQFQHKVTFATDVAVVDAYTGEVVWNYRDKVADGWQADNETSAELEGEKEDDAEWEEEDDPATYEFEPGRVYWNEMAANP
jgi:hypothetical protein